MSPAPGKIIAGLALLGTALCVYFGLPGNVVIFGDETAQRNAQIIMGALIIVFNAIQNQVPRFQDAPPRTAKPDPTVSTPQPRRRHDDGEV